MEWTSLANGLEARDSALNQSQDPRIGSSRDNSTTGTISHVTSSGTESSSASSLGSTFIPVLVYSGVCLTIFFVFRRKCQRVYAPRTLAGIRRPPHEPVPALPNTWFSWIKDFYRIDDKFILNNTSLDGFLFLRYIRILATICFAGCVISWPVLLSVNATGGNKLSELNLLTIGDVSNPQKFYAHALISWLFFGFILMMICRECIYYINLRQAYLMTPQHAHRLSARTVLFTCVPKRFLDEHRIRKLFGDSVKNVWIPRNTRALLRLVEERESAAVRLEKAEIELIKRANLARKKLYGHGQALPLPVSTPGTTPPSRSTTSSSLGSSASASSAKTSPSLTTTSPTSPASSPSRPPSSRQSSSRPSSSAVSLRSSLSSPAAAAPVSPYTPATPAAVLATTSKIDVPPLPPSPPPPSRRAPAALQQPAEATPRDASASLGSSTEMPWQSPLPGFIDIGAVGDIQQPDQAQIKNSVQVDITATDARGSFSDAGSGPSSTTAAASSVPMSDVTEVGVAADEPKGKDRETTTRIISNLGEDDDDDNEMNYVHPYGFAPNLPDIRGSVAAQWLPAEKRPRHRPLANFGRNVDTIRWTRMRVQSLNQAIAKTRRRFRAGDGQTLSSMFVEFDTQAAAQVAFQVLSHHQPLHMSPRFIGIRPQDVIWSSLRMRWWERIVRRFLIMGAIAAGIVFWSLPAALVGVVSNVSFLSSKVFFLHWIADLPSAITGVIEGLLPAVALSLLMAAVPGMLRAAARTAGVVSAPMVETFTQNAYFCFQVVQVFLVTTLTSAASAAFTKILEDPLSVKDLLSENLPKASNFYLSYITVQCLAGGAIGLVHFFDLFRHTLLARAINHPRRAVRNYQRLKQPHWGGVFPVYTNMGVIAISYTCIAPLILVFAGVGMLVTYQVYKYNLLYHYDADRDSKGLHYPRGLLHLMIGIYLAQVCLIGLFSLQSAIGPVIMMVVFLIFTFLVHISLNDAVTPLLYNLPRTLALEDKDLAAGHEDLREAAEKDAADAAAATASGNDAVVGLNADYYQMEEGASGSGGGAGANGGTAEDYDYDDDEGYGLEHNPDDDLHSGPTMERGIDGAGDLMGIFKEWGRDALKQRIKSETKAIKADVKSDGRAFKLSVNLNIMQRLPKSVQAKLPKSWTSTGEELDADGKPVKKANFLMRWLHPELYEDYTYLRKMITSDKPIDEYPPDYARRGYWPPEMWSPIPRLWIPRDEAHVSRQEVAHTRKVLPITDRGAWLTPKGNVVADLDKAPFLEPIYLY